MKGWALPEADWERRIGGLIVEPEPEPNSRAPIVVGLDHLIVSQALVRKLAVAARALVADESYGEVYQLAGVLGSHEACRLASDLAELAPPTVTATPDPVATYIRALREAVYAVYYCRRIAHAGGQCWFSPADPDAQWCARVLALAHRLG